MGFSADTITIIVSIATVGVMMMGLTLITTGRLGSRITGVENRLIEVESKLSERLSVVEMETARMSGMLEGLSLAGRLPAKKGES